MLQLIERIRERLAQSAYANEAAISHGVVTPLLNALGWDSADPTQLVPEYTIERGRVDFALLTIGRKPAVFIEVKGIGRAMDGDRQLFEYAYHRGVPLCVLTDGREWSFYVPGGQGSYDDRRVYRLQLDDREPEECARILNRYLDRSRVRDGSAFEDAQRDYRDAAGRREAADTLPHAWDELMLETDELLVDAVSDKAEALCGFKPAAADVLAFLRRLRAVEAITEPSRRKPPTALATAPTTKAEIPEAAPSPPELPDRTVSFTLLGQQRNCPNASRALIELLRMLAERDSTKIADLANAVRGRSRSLIARTVDEINPARPHLARATEFAPGWLIGGTTSNRDKMGIIRTACEIYALRMPDDLDIALPNAN